MDAMTQTNMNQKPAGASTFEADSLTALRTLQSGLFDIMERLQPPVLRAADLRRAIGLSQQVSWGLFASATARDARQLASLLPGGRAMESFFAAAQRQGVPADAIERARASFEQVEEIVATHAGSRATFESMLAGIESATGGESGEQTGAGVKHKRAAFRANTQMWGRAVRVNLATTIFHPSAAADTGEGTGGKADLALIRGAIGASRLRRTIPLRITVFDRHFGGQNDTPELIAPQPLDPDGPDENSIGFLSAFCPSPLPKFKLVETRDGNRKFELQSDAVGTAGEITYYTGEIFRAYSAIPAQGQGQDFGMAKLIDVPTETWIGDLIIHKSLWGTRPPEVRVFAVPTDGAYEFHESDALPLAEKAEYLGDGIQTARTPLIPRYTEMLAFAMNRLGWNPDEFRVFRCQVEYPVLYSCIRVFLR